MAPVRGSQGQSERHEAWDFTAEGLALKRQISALARMARETMGAIE
jgi:hypothetical protein